MPHALTSRQKEYLSFLREYIKENESSPRLEEIAKHFGVKSPTAHKTLKALQSKGYLFFGRDSTSGFFIRLVERAGTSEIMIEVPIAGKVNRYGEIYEFPEKHGHFASVLMGANPEDVFALVVTENIPEANMLANDLLICDLSKRPQPSDIAILPFGKEAKRFFLCQIYSLTMDRDMESFEASNQYPIPEDLIDDDFGQRFNWAPLAFTEDTDEYFDQVVEETGVPMRAAPLEVVMGTVLRLSRKMAF